MKIEKTEVLFMDMDGFKFMWVPGKNYLLVEYPKGSRQFERIGNATSKEMAFDIAATFCLGVDLGAGKWIEIEALRQHKVN